MPANGNESHVGLSGKVGWNRADGLNDSLHLIVSQHCVSS